MKETRHRNVNLNWREWQSGKILGKGEGLWEGEEMYKGEGKQAGPAGQLGDIHWNDAKPNERP